MAYRGGELPQINVDTLDAAWQDATANAGRMQGARACARCYVIFVGLDRAARQRLKNWAGFRNRIFQKDAAYGFGDALYVGYDNATGIEGGFAEALAAALKARGVQAYADFGQD